MVIVHETVQCVMLTAFSNISDHTWRRYGQAWKQKMRGTRWTLPLQTLLV